MTLHFVVQGQQSYSKLFLLFLVLMLIRPSLEVKIDIRNILAPTTSIQLSLICDRGLHPGNNFMNSFIAARSGNFGNWSYEFKL